MSALRGERRHGRGVVGRDAALEGERRDGAVHGARIEAVDAEMVGHGLETVDLPAPAGPSMATSNAGGARSASAASATRRREASEVAGKGGVAGGHGVEP